MEKLEDINIECLDLTVRSWRDCKRYGIRTIGDLMKLSNEEIFNGICNKSKIVYNDIQIKLPKYIDNYKKDNRNSL